MVFLEPSVKQRLRRKRPSEKLLWRRNSAWPARHKPPTDCGQRPRNGRHDLLVKLTWMHYAKFIINRRWINRCVCRETARLQFRLPDGSSMTETFPSSSSLLTAVDVVRLASSLLSRCIYSQIQRRQAFSGKVLCTQWLRFKCQGESQKLSACALCRQVFMVVFTQKSVSNCCYLTMTLEAFWPYPQQVPATIIYCAGPPS